MPFIDTHCHTLPFSPDADTTLEMHCLAARARGLDGFILTDHCDMTGWFEDEGYVKLDFRRDESYALVCAMREKYPDLYIGFGAELGEWYFDREDGNAFAADTRLDFLLGSLHTLDGEDFYIKRYESLAHCDRLLAAYAEELLDHCKNSPMDSFAHLTYPLRYMKKAGFEPDFTKQRDAVAEAFRALIDRGIALEVNTSGLRQNLGATLPDRYWLELYRDLGGEMLTLGSDAHHHDHLGANFADAAELLRSIGFDRVYYYRDRKPIAMTL